MNLSVLCVLVSVLYGCVMAEPEGAAPGSSQASAQTSAAAADPATATPEEGDFGRDKRFFVNHPITGQLHFAYPVSGGVEGAAPSASFPNTRPAGFPQSRTSFPAQHPFPHTPSLRTSNSPFPDYNPRYRSSRGREGASFQELADYVNQQRWQQENRDFQLRRHYERQHLRSRQFPDVIDTEGNSFPESPFPRPRS